MLMIAFLLALQHIKISLPGGGKSPEKSKISWWFQCLAKRLVSTSVHCVRPWTPPIVYNGSHQSLSFWLYISGISITRIFHLQRSKAKLLLARTSMNRWPRNPARLEGCQLLPLMIRDKSALHLVLPTRHCKRLHTDTSAKQLQVKT